MGAYRLRIDNPRFLVRQRTSACGACENQGAPWRGATTRPEIGQRGEGRNGGRGEPLRLDTRTVVHLFHGKARGRDILRKSHVIYRPQRLHILRIGLLLEALIADFVGNQHRSERNAPPWRAQFLICAGFKNAFPDFSYSNEQNNLGRETLQQPAFEISSNASFRNTIPRRNPAGEDFAPHRIFDAPFGLPVAVQGFIHPPQFLLGHSQAVCARRMQTLVPRRVDCNLRK